MKKMILAVIAAALLGALATSCDYVGPAPLGVGLDNGTVG